MILLNAHDLLVRCYHSSPTARLGLGIAASLCATGAATLLLRKTIHKVAGVIKHLWEVLRHYFDPRGTRVTTTINLTAGDTIHQYLELDSDVGDSLGHILTGSGPSQALVLHRTSRRQRCGTVVTIAHEARNKFFLEKRDKANLLVVRRFIYERMVEVGMRPSHIAAQLPICVSLAFTISQGEILDLEFRASDAYALHQAPRVYVAWMYGFIPVLRTIQPYEPGV